MFDGNVTMNVHSTNKKKDINPSRCFNIYNTMRIGKISTNITEQEEAEAEALLLEELNKGDRFIATGCRNDTAVNMCIALHVLGIYEIYQWFSKFFNAFDERFDSVDVDLFMDHVKRVLEYIDTWGPEGSEGEALVYAL